MEIAGSEIETAYRKLKSYVYYDKTDLRLRERLAKFECSPKFANKLRAVREVADSHMPSTDERFRKWLTAIDFRVVPKRLKPLRNEDAAGTMGKGSGKFITNVTSVDTIEVATVNYFFDGPIELHLMAVLWLMREGRYLDDQLLPECCGSRLSPRMREEDDDSLQLFMKYHEQYSRWRDTGIKKAKQLLVEEGRNVAILGLDLQEYFYRVDIDFKEVGAALATASRGAIKAGKDSLLACIEAVCKTYRSRISPLLGMTHHDIGPTVTGLPIGLCSSVLLANWYLQDFDTEVLDSVRPAYYGRYVDDILLVVPTAKDPTQGEASPVTAFIQDLLVRTKLLKAPVDDVYCLKARPGLRLQQSKCILQYFDARHSIAGLEKFKKKLEQNGSEFRLLPVDEADNSMEDVAYDLLYDGSVNKFRSVKGVAENRYELAKHLARQTMLHLLTDDPPDRKVSKGLQNFFKGRSAIEYFDLWERVLTLLAIAGDRTTLKSFVRQLKGEIARVHAKDTAVTKRLVSGLERHLSLALSMSDAVCEVGIELADLIEDAPSKQFRRANLLRHHYVRAPLLNFTDYTGPLSKRRLAAKVRKDRHKLAYTPRFLNFDECMLLAYSGNVVIGKRSSYEYAVEVFKSANRQTLVGVDWSEPETGSDARRAG